MSTRQIELSDVANWLRKAERVVGLTGAGISTESGIQDFRGPHGLWTSNPGAERLSHIHHYMSDPTVRVEAWRARLEHPAWSSQPNAGHRALVDLEGMGKLHTLITQNIDGLHQIAGTSGNRLIEIHGTIRRVVCMGCGEISDMQRALGRVRAGEADPGCLACGGILKSATISFGQSLNEADLRRALAAARACDVFLAVGTSLVVYPVAVLPQVALDGGARLVIFNESETPYDRLADAVVRDRIGRSLPSLMELL
jgi:NAD-dependent deacetylase